MIVKMPTRQYPCPTLSHQTAYPTAGVPGYGRYGGVAGSWHEGLALTLEVLQ